MTDSTTSPGFEPDALLKGVTHRSGVYRMLDGQGTVIYVGKARDLKRRLTSYFRGRFDSPKTRAMVAQVNGVEVTVTHNENEALILENQLIKALKPRYNVLLRDDKSYPFIYVSTDQDYPRLGFHRGAKRARGRYFGPFPSAQAVRETLNLLQKLFRVRQCQDSFYRNRSRPCLQYQIDRCTAPCVGLVEQETYQRDVRHALMFLEGKDSQLIDELVARMEQASQALAFEEAARYRDQIGSLRRIRKQQYVSTEGGNADVVACATGGGMACVEVFYVRGGHNLGNKTFFPRAPGNTEAGEVLGAFLAQYYLERQEVPGEILVGSAVSDAAVLQGVLAAQSGHRVAITHRVRGQRARWVEMALDNARHALERHLASRASLYRRFQALQELFDLDDLPQRMECFDISHTMGEATVASCVVFDHEGPVKSDYRRFNIEGIAPGDDFAALRVALTRRYRRLKQGEGKLPDVLWIDGGKGQLAQAEQVLEELQVEGVTVAGVAKGPTRKAGLETLFLSGRNEPIILASDSPALHLIQQVRDEAHRFAITGHRQRRARSRTTSVLEDIPGLGPKRRGQLLRQFGGLQELTGAGVEDLATVQGISRQLAERIYDALHEDR